MCILKVSFKFFHYFWRRQYICFFPGACTTEERGSKETGLGSNSTLRDSSQWGTNILLCLCFLLPPAPSTSSSFFPSKPSLLPEQFGLTNIFSFQMIQYPWFPKQMLSYYNRCYYSQYSGILADFSNCIIWFTHYCVFLLLCIPDLPAVQTCCVNSGTS